MTFGFGKHCGRIFIAHMAIHKTKFFSFYSYILLYVDYAYHRDLPKWSKPARISFN